MKLTFFASGHLQECVLHFNSHSSSYATKNTEDRWLNPRPPGNIFDLHTLKVVSTMAGSFAVALADRNIAELVKHSTDTIQVGRDDLGLG